jgi:hypothetical protein
MVRRRFAWKRQSTQTRKSKPTITSSGENRRGARTIMDDVLEDADRANRKKHNPFEGERYAYLSQSHVREDRIFEAGKSERLISKPIYNRTDRQSD